MICVPAILAASRLLTQLRDLERTRLEAYTSGRLKMFTLEEWEEEPDITGMMEEQARGWLDIIGQHLAAVESCRRSVALYLGIGGYRTVAAVRNLCRSQEAFERMNRDYCHRVRLVDCSDGTERDTGEEEFASRQVRVELYQRYLLAHDWGWTKEWD